MPHRPDAPHQTLGGRMGPRMAKVMVDALADYHLRTAGHKARQSAEGANEFFRGMSREKQQHTASMWEWFLGGELTPPELEKVMRFIAHGQGELSELMGTLGAGNVIGTSILSSIQNYLAPLNQDLIEVQPNSLLDPAVAASLIQRGWLDVGSGEAEAAKGGINTHRFNLLRHMATNFPGIGELLELERRGLISQEQVREGLTRNGVSGEFLSPLLNLKRVHLAPADLALMSLRGIISEAEGATGAAFSGLEAADFDLLVKATGEPPGLMQLLEAFRRGFIDKERLEKGVRESRVRNEWMDVVEKLRFTPASASDALRGVIQGHLGKDEGKQIAEWNGLRPEDWDWLEKTEGNPPGVQQMLQLYNRGVVTDRQVEEAIRESRLKNKYIGPVKHLAVKLPEGRQITQMIGRGTLSHTRGVELLRDLGYEPDVAHALVESALTSQVAREKQLGASQISELYHDHALGEAAALKHLEALGYHTDNAKLLLHLADVKRAHTQQTAALAPIRAAYIARHITEPEASIEIDKLGIEAAQRDYLLALWSIERYAHRKGLTEAQIVKANMNGLFTDEVAIARLENMGFSGEDAKIILDLEKGRTTPA